jgi:hypothetical protein
MAFFGNFHAMILKSYPTDPKSAVFFVEQYKEYMLQDNPILRWFFKLDAAARLAFFQKNSEAHFAAFCLFLDRVVYSCL